MTVQTHGGYPSPGSGATVTVDATDLQLLDPTTGNPLGTVLPVDQAFKVAAVFQIGGTGTWPTNMVHDPSVLVAINYMFSPRGGGTPTSYPPDAGAAIPLSTLTPQGSAPPYTFGASSSTATGTTATVPANALTPGLYELSAVITFPQAGSSTPWDMSAFADFQVIEFFQP